MKKLVILDGLAYAYRGFYAVPEMHSAKGEPTNAVYGFLSALLRAQKQFKPDYAVVAWDAPGPTFRDALLTEYKAQRQPTPEALKAQLPVISELVPLTGWVFEQRKGFESDDIQATLAMQGLKAGWEVVIMSTDKDILQLIQPGLTVWRENPKGASLYGPEKVFERYGIKPEQMVDLLALMGDASDNIPGVPGIGEKTAAQLLQEHGSLEAVLAAAPSIKKPKLSQNLRDFADQARASHKLAELVKDVPLSVKLGECGLRPADPGLLPRLKELGLNKLYMDFTPLVAMTESAAPALKAPADAPAKADSKAGAKPKARAGKAAELKAQCFESVAQLEAWLAKAKPAKGHCLGALLHPEGNPERLVLSDGKAAAVLSPLPPAGERKALCRALPALALWGSKPLFNLLAEAGEPKSVLDLQVAGYLIEPGRSLRSLADLAVKLGVEGDAGGEAAGQDSLFVDVDALGRVAALCAALSGAAHERLDSDGLRALHDDIEGPLTPLLARMERDGIGLDVEVLAELDAKAQKEMAHLVKRAHAIAGREFNLNSPTQLSQVLFEELKLPHQHKTKTGAYSTDTEVLEELAEGHQAEIAQVVLDHRGLAKLSGTYLQALPRLVSPQDGRLHTSWNQAVTTTGRLSSSDPNLQNIPVRTGLGREIRKAFVPGRTGDLILAADYSQIELRILAHYSGDGHLTDAFKRGEDIHAQTAARVFGVAPDKVGPDQRRQAKVINFGVIYGMSPFGLSRQLGIPVGQAKAFIEAYFAQFPKVRACLDGFIEQARRDGYVTTLMGRRRYLPDVLSANRVGREAAERMAINAPIQGTAADLIKKAMLDVQALLDRKRARTRMLLQVHDELVLDLAAEEAEALPDQIKKAMESVIKLHVPLEVGMGMGANWFEAK